MVQVGIKAGEREMASEGNCWLLRRKSEDNLSSQGYCQCHLKVLRDLCWEDPLEKEVATHSSTLA